MIAVVGIIALEELVAHGVLQINFNIKAWKIMKILFVSHASFEKPGSIESWAKNNGHDTSEVCPFKGERLPDVNDFDFLVVMGGPQSPLRMDEAPYLVDEIELIKHAIKNCINVLLEFVLALN